MDRTERFYRIDQLLQARRAVPMKMLVEELDVSRATIKRDLEYLRDRLNAPIIWDRSMRGYRYQSMPSDAPRFSLPGLWFNASEIHALLVMEQLLSNLQPGLLKPHIEPLRTRIRLLLDAGDHSAEQVVRRIKVLRMGPRPVEPARFEVIVTGLLRRQRLQIEHYNRRTDQTTQREVSPQRLVYYRDNWYLDAWCQLRQALRSFSLDALLTVELQPTRRAREVAGEVLDDYLGAGYGIFAGGQTRKAVLRFCAERARWIAREVWHSAQQSQFDAAGRYVLTIPYTNDTELLLDVLRYGPDVEVLEPITLRNKVRERLRLAQALYDD